MFAGLTKDLCKKALQVVEPAILAASEQGIIKRDHGCLVVLNPTRPFSAKTRYDRPEFEFEDDLILFEKEFGNYRKWEHQYHAIAVSKAFISWKTGLSSRQVQLEAPYLYSDGMTKFGGSAVGEGGLVVAFSGVEEWFDQMISEMMLAAIKGVCLHEMHKPNGVMANNVIECIGEE